MTKLLRYIELATALLGITGVFYAFGFLAQRAHFRLLGAMDIPISNQKYFETGGYFVYKSIMVLPSALLYLLKTIIINWYWIVSFIVIILIFKYCSKKINALLYKRKIIKSQNETNQKICNWALVSLLVILISFIFAISFPLFTSPLKINGLLFKFAEFTKKENTIHFNKNVNVLQVNINKNKLSKIIDADILGNNEKKLVLYYIQLELIIIIFIVTIIFLKYWGRKKTTLFETSSILLYLYLGFCFFVSLHILLLPLNFGVLLIDDTYSKVNVNFTEKKLKSNKYFMVGQSNNDVGFYDPHNNQVIIYSKQYIKSINIIGEEPIFYKPE